MNKKILYDIFCGTKSVSNVAIELGYDVITLDIEKKFNPTICIDFLDWDYTTIEKINHIHFSPDCSCYSMASGGKHFNKQKEPLTNKAKNSLLILDKIKKCISYLRNKFPNLTFTIENPRARMRWFINEYPLKGVCYCKYGFDRMKPTDIWTNIDFDNKMCKNNNPNCNHIRCPRGSLNGTQGLKKIDRYKIPKQLILEILQN
tara:strand:+ start:1403 stop:2011 length:609 start_codon:yes stop_codon:yes gene_type:complete